MYGLLKTFKIIKSIFNILTKNFMTTTLQQNSQQTLLPIVDLLEDAVNARNKYFRHCQKNFATIVH